MSSNSITSNQISFIYVKCILRQRHCINIHSEVLLHYRSDTDIVPERTHAPKHLLVQLKKEKKRHSEEKKSFGRNRIVIRKESNQLPRHDQEDTENLP
jgi:hypothetical protein